MIQSGTIIKIDRFDQDISSAWNGGTDAWSITANNALTDSSLKGNGTGDGSETIYSEQNDGLGYYPEKGDIISAYHRENNATDNRIRAGIGWAIEQVSGTSLNGYGIDPQGDNNEINLVKYDNSSSIYDITRPLTIDVGSRDFREWFEVEIEWHDGSGSESEDTFVINVYDIDSTGSPPYPRVSKIGSGKYQDSDYASNRGVSIRNHTTRQSERTCIDLFMKRGVVE